MPPSTISWSSVRKSKMLGLERFCEAHFDKSKQRVNRFKVIFIVDANELFCRVILQHYHSFVGRRFSDNRVRRETETNLV